MKPSQTVPSLIFISVIALSTLAPCTSAQTTAHTTPHTATSNLNETTERHQARGVITQVNAQRGFVVVHHEPIETLGWEEMTMPLPVTDKKLLEGIEVGDHVLLDLSMPDEVATISAITVIEPPK